MKYISIDIETTGLNPKTDNILEIGAIIEDTATKLPREQCPTFHVYIDRESYSGNPFALALNAPILKKIADLKKSKDTVQLLPETGVAAAFQAFLDGQFIVGKILPAGKNFGSFDLQFLLNLPNFNKIKLSHRQLDPSMFFVDFKNGNDVPDLTTCKKLANLPELVTHTALDDAWDVITLLRTKY